MNIKSVLESLEKSVMEESIVSGGITGVSTPSEGIERYMRQLRQINALCKAIVKRSEDIYAESIKNKHYYMDDLGTMVDDLKSVHGINQDEQ